MSNQTTAVSLRDASMDALGQIGQNPQKYADFLRLQGRVFKHSPYIALAFYAQNPDTQFIASREQWEGLHYTVNSGAAAIRYTGGDGKTVDLYDFSQIKEEIPPYLWTVNRQNAGPIKAGLGVNEQDSLLMGALRQSLTVDHITTCMRVLGIPPQEFETFRTGYVTAV